MESILFDRDWKYCSGRYSSFAPFNPSNIPSDDWKAVDLPHDAAIGLERSADYPTGFAEAYTQPNMFYYKKTFDCPREWSGKTVLAEFEGVYMNAEVMLNGNHLAFHSYGYTSFLVDLSDYLKYGDSNEMLLIVDNLAKPSCRWYTGAGIYRHVRIHIAEDVAVHPWDMHIDTPVVDAYSAQIHMTAYLTNQSGKSKTGKIEYAVFQMDDLQKPVLNDTAAFRISGNKEKIEKTCVLANPKLWDVVSPNLYRFCYTIRLDNGTVCDSGEVTFGIRSFSCDSLNGFRLNGRSLKLKGGCVHHDNGPLGVASFDEAEERRVRLLKEAGYNAIRCAHNPLSPGFLDVCDRVGMLVIDEIFDNWQVAKNPHDYHIHFRDLWKEDLRSTVYRDYNHPSIVMWSIGNEVAERDGSSRGAEICRMLANYTRELDHTRLITSAVNAIPLSAAAANDNWAANMKGNVVHKERDEFGEKTQAYFDALDVAGYNYLTKRYAFDRERFPQRVIMGVETYPHTLYENWTETVKNPNVAGDFVWTSWDYLGESGIGKVEYDVQNGWGGAFPWFYANCGDFDVCGVKRPQSYYRDILWGLRQKPYIGVYDPEVYGKKLIFKEWAWEPVQANYTFPGCEGMKTAVDVYCANEEVELFVNGVSCGRKPSGAACENKTTFEITYLPGELKAVAYQNGQAVSEEILYTSGKAEKIQLEAETPNFLEGQRHLYFVHAKVTDKEGNLIYCSGQSVQFECTGAGRILAVANGDPCTTESFTAKERTIYQGRAMVILERTGDEEICLKAVSDDFDSAEIKLV